MLAKISLAELKFGYKSTNQRQYRKTYYFYLDIPKCFRHYLIVLNNMHPDVNGKNL